LGLKKDTCCTGAGMAQAQKSRFPGKMIHV
jgi:hypothetical protein